MTANTGGQEPTRLDAPETQRRGRIPADTFANRLVLARRLAGLTIRDAAEACSLNYGSWSNWENGKRPADILDVAQRIADALDIDEQWLLFGGPLEGPRGRRVRPSSDRSDGISPPYRRAPSGPVRPPVRPKTDRTNVRPDRRGPIKDNLDRTRRPVRVS